MKKLLLLIFTFAFFSINAQITGKYYIKAQSIFDSESGEFRSGISLLIKNGKIEKVVKDNEITSEEKKEYTFIDLSNSTLLPGLIDSHTHLLYKEVLYPFNQVESVDMAKNLTLNSDAYRALYGAARAKAYLEAGITSVQDLGNSGQFGDMALKRAINENLVPGPRMRCSGPGLSPEGGQMPGLIYKHRSLIDDEYRIIKGREDAIQAVRENITQGADIIKIYANYSPNNIRLSFEEMKAIVDEAHRNNIRVTAHATDNKGIYDAVTAGVDAIEHGYNVNDTTLELMAKKNVVLVPTDGDSVTAIQVINLAQPGHTEIYKYVMDHRRKLADRLHRAINKGVCVAAGSDDYTEYNLPFAEPSKRTLIGYTEAGIKIPQVLQFATINASKQLNLSNKIGIIKPGYLADIIAVDPDIYKNIYAIMNIHFVMKGGKVIVASK